MADDISGKDLQSLGRRAARSSLRLGDALEDLKGILLFGSFLVIVLVVGTPFLPNASSQILAGILTAGITTALSIYATYRAADQGTKKELTRYGLLAWRNLDSLQLKIAQQLDGGYAASGETLREWGLDVDQAKWAWRDLLREVFELEARLQTETYELAKDYKTKIGAASNPAEARKLEIEQVRELARLTSASRLPLRLPAEVRCPYCGDVTSVLVGSNPGDTGAAACSHCAHQFNAHRNRDGSLFTRQIGDGNSRTSLKFAKPEIHFKCLKAVENVFAGTPEKRIADWHTFYAKVGAQLQAMRIDPAESNVVQRWLFRLKAFRLLGPGNGIELVPDPADLVSFVEQRVVARISEPISAGDLCTELYGASRDRVESLEALLARKSEPGDLGQ